MSSLSSFSVPQGSSWSSYLRDAGGGGPWFEDTCKPNKTTTASYHNWQKGTSLLTTNESEDDDGPGGGGGQVIGDEVDYVDYCGRVLFWTFLTVSIGYLFLCFIAILHDISKSLPKDDDDKSYSSKVCVGKDPTFLAFARRRWMSRPYRAFPHHFRMPVVRCLYVKCTKDRFEVKMNVEQFSPEEVTVTAADKYLVVEGKHEEKQDEHGMNMSRSFTRCYRLPEDLNAKSFDERVTCTWSPDGVLLITVPRKEAIVEKGAAKVLPIKQT